MEEIRDVVGYEGLYKVSNIGNIYSTLYRKNIKLKQFINTHGYAMVTLCKDKKQTKHSIHRIVADAFLPKVNITINHIDGVKTNNNVNNLEWCSYSENNIHAILTGLRVKNVGVNHYNARAVICTDDNGLETEFPTAVEAVKNGMATNTAHIQSCCTGRRKKHNKLKWRYKNV